MEPITDYRIAKLEEKFQSFELKLDRWLEKIDLLLLKLTTLEQKYIALEERYKDLIIDVSEADKQVLLVREDLGKLKVSLAERALPGAAGGAVTAGLVTGIVEFVKYFIEVK